MNLLNNKRLLVWGGVALLVVIAWFGVMSVGNKSNTALLEIQVVPSDASIFINDKGAREGINRLKPGNYTVKAVYEGFKPEEKIVTLYDQQTSYVGFVLSDDGAALNWYQAHPEDEKKSEGISSRIFDETSKALTQSNPVFSKLPYDDLNGPFSINYGASKARKGGTVVSISFSTPKSRQKALQWIREQGSDPSDLEIRFDDFVNPLTTGGAR